MVEKANRNTFWLVLGIVAVVFIIVMIAIKAKNPQLSWSRWTASFVGISIFLAACGSGAYFLTKRRADPGQQKGMPPAITFAQARDIARDALRDPVYMDEFDMNRIWLENVASIGHPASDVYLIIVAGKKARNNIYAIALNMHYPAIKRGFDVSVNGQESKAQILAKAEKMRRHLGISPHQEILPKTTVVQNPVTGTSVITTDPGNQQEPKQEKKEDPLASNG